MPFGGDLDFSWRMQRRTARRLVFEPGALVRHCHRTTWSGLLALYEKNVPFERVRALHGDCNRTDFLHVNPRAEVPALVDGTFQLFDSTVICEYIEDRYPHPPLYPKNAERRATCRLIEDLSKE